MEPKCNLSLVILLAKILLTHACRKSSPVISTTIPTTSTSRSTISRESGLSSSTLNSLSDEQNSVEVPEVFSSIVPEDEETNPLVRKDKRCGSSFKLDNGSISECDPYNDMYYCCSKWGYCGDTSEHCECSECVDYRQHYSLNITTKVKDTKDDASGNQTFRSDGRCGSEFVLPNGDPAECEPTGEYFCCSKWGFCGMTDEHCDCTECIDYRIPESERKKIRQSKPKSTSSAIGTTSKDSKKSDDISKGNNHDVTLKDTEEEKKPLVLRSCLNFGLPPIKPPPMDKDEDVSYDEDEEDGEEEEEEEEKISTPFRNNGGFSGKPSGNSKSPVNKKTKKTVKNVKKSGSISECRDQEDWCKHEPNCNFEEVETNCPKYCGICKETPPCEDFEGWCKHEPKCEHEDVQDSCPKLCGTCEVIEDPECEDLEEWCKHEPECDHDDVQKSCPKLCGTCKARRKRSSSNDGEAKPKMINGYYENWRAPINRGEGETKDPSFYRHDIASLTHVFYSFLCLDRRPNPDIPAKKHWNGKALYESMTAANVIDVMTEKLPRWDNQYEWQRSKIAALIDAVHDNNAKFIWAIGGWSDLTKTLEKEQIPLFVEKIVELLKLGKGKLGDGIDFDWEHLNEDADTKDEQRIILAETILALRNALDKEGMHDKQIGYTTRFNAFWDNDHGNKPEGYTYFASDGEGLKVEETLNKLNSSLNDTVDWVNIMQYDVSPSDLNCPDRMELDTYKKVLGAFTKYVDKDKLVIGFEPGHQAAGGLWEGCEVDTEVVNYVQEQKFGGVMFWAVNEHANSRENGVTGQNAQQLAKYAKNVFNTTPR